MDNIKSNNEALLDCMCENERFKFENWIDELNDTYKKAQGDKFGSGRVEDSTGLNYWLDYFVEGKSAREALVSDAADDLLESLN